MFAWGPTPRQHKPRVEKSVSVEAVKSLEYVLISDGMHHNEQEQGNGTSCKPLSILKKFFAEKIMAQIS